MTKLLSEIVKINSSFCRSININEDLNKQEILSNYICSPSIEVTLLNIANNIANTNQSAFTLTGPYGSGKSTFGIFFSSLLSTDAKLRNFAKSILTDKTSKKFYSDLKVKKGWDVLPIMGSSKNFEELLKTSLFQKTKKPVNDIYKAIDDLSKENDGLIIIVDEMGKCLENSAKNDGDIFIFQQLAEFVSRKNKRVILMGILHQAFSEYARYLPHTIRDEWIKIQGRYIDIPVNTASEEQIELIGKSISSNIKNSSFEKEIDATLENISKNKIIVSPKKLKESLVKCWPISPIVVFLLTQISQKRFGQNQRSIFAFLNSAEPNSFREFVYSNEYSENIEYMPINLFDYIKINFESSIIASSDSKLWNLSTDVLNRCLAKGASPNHIIILKTLILIDLFGNSGLTANKVFLQKIYPKINIEQILKDLQSWSVIIYKKHINSYSIYEGSDFDIESALKEAYSNIHEIDLDKLSNIANFKPVIAKRHYHTSGSMRWFDILLTSSSSWKTFLNEEKQQRKSMGFFNVILPNANDDIEKIKKDVIKNKFDFPVISTITSNVQIIREYLQELLALEWIQKNKNELSGDQIAKKEIEGRISIIIPLLEEQLNKILQNSEWFYNGKLLGKIPQSKLSTITSDIADEVYTKSPIIKSELLNRTKPSASANTGLNTLLKDMVLHAGKPLLSITGFTPERGLFNILLKDTGIYKEKKDTFVFTEPAANNLDKLWNFNDHYLKNNPRLINLEELYNLWSLPPFGIKYGLYSFIFLSYILTRKDKIAVYRDDVYVPDINDLFIDYLIKNPKCISVKYIDIKDNIDDYLRKLSTCLNQFLQNPITNFSALNIAQKIVLLVDTLHPWVLKTKNLSSDTIHFREVVKSANDPNKLLIEDLPKIFSKSSTKNSINSDEIISNLTNSIVELQELYPNTMKEIALLITQELDIPFADEKSLHELQERAKKIKGISGNFRIDAFASRLSTFNSTLNDISGLVGLANNKPPHYWIDLDIENAKKELLRLCIEFKKTELFVKIKHRSADRQGIAIISGIGEKSKIFSGEFDILKTKNSKVKELEKKIMSSIKDEKDTDVLLMALTNLTINYLKEEKND